MSPFLARLKCPLFLLLNSVGVEFLSPFGFRLERACKVDRCLWKKVNPMMEPPSGLVGTVESVLCFPSRCGNPRCERISISGVSSHRPSVSFFFAPFFVSVKRGASDLANAACLVPCACHREEETAAASLR